MKFLLAFLFLCSSTASASFDQNSRRYLSYYELINSLNSIFLAAGEADQSGYTFECRKLENDNKLDLGYNNPATGEPQVAGPNAGYVRWLGNCVSKYMMALRFQYISKVTLLSEVAKQYFSIKYSETSILYYLDYEKFDDLSEQIQTDIIEHAFSIVFGSDEVFNEFGLMDAKVFKEKVKAKIKRFFTECKQGFGNHNA